MEGDSISEAEGSTAEETVLLAAKRTHVVCSNSYFTFTDNPGYPDVKVSVVPRWCRPEHLGVENKSRTVVVSHFGEARANPVRSVWVLKAWMLYKSRQGDFATGDRLVVGCSHKKPETFGLRS